MGSQEIRSYRDLAAWQEAMILAELIYKLTVKLPQSERYELSAQMRRAVVSIPSNIAEGYARESVGSYGQFLKIARGSLRELETQLLLAGRVGLVATSDAEPAIKQCDRVARLLHGLIRSLLAGSKGE